MDNINNNNNTNMYATQIINQQTGSPIQLQPSHYGTMGQIQSQLLQSVLSTANIVANANNTITPVDQSIQLQQQSQQQQHHHHHNHQCGDDHQQPLQLSLVGATTQPTTGEGVISPAPPTKKRAKRACVNCRQSKVACDQQRPCVRCTKHGIEDKCHDVPRKTKVVGKRVKKDAVSGPSADYVASAIQSNATASENQPSTDSASAAKPSKRGKGSRKSSASSTTTSTTSTAATVTTLPLVLSTPIINTSDILSSPLSSPMSPQQTPVNQDLPNQHLVQSIKANTNLQQQLTLYYQQRQQKQQLQQLKQLQQQQQDQLLLQQSTSLNGSLLQSPVSPPSPVSNINNNNNNNNIPIFKFGQQPSPQINNMELLNGLLEDQPSFYNVQQTNVGFNQSTENLTTPKMNSEIDTIINDSNMMFNATCTNLLNTNSVPASPSHNPFISYNIPSSPSSAFSTPSPSLSSASSSLSDSHSLPASPRSFELMNTGRISCMEEMTADNHNIDTHVPISASAISEQPQQTQQHTATVEETTPISSPIMLSNIQNVYESVVSNIQSLINTSSAFQEPIGVGSSPFGYCFKSPFSLDGVPNQQSQHQLQLQQQQPNQIFAADSQNQISNLLMAYQNQQQQLLLQQLSQNINNNNNNANNMVQSVQPDLLVMELQKIHQSLNVINKFLRFPSTPNSAQESPVLAGCNSSMLNIPRPLYDVPPKNPIIPGSLWLPCLE